MKQNRRAILALLAFVPADLKVVILAGCLCCCITTRAQLNESDTLRFAFRVAASGNYQRGNVRLALIRGRAEVLYAPLPALVFKSQNSSLHQRFGKIKADADVFSRNYVYYKPANRVYAFGIAYVSANYRRKIDSRLFGGTGLTWQVVRAKQHHLKFSASLVYEATRFSADRFNRNSYNGSSKISLWRTTLYTAGWHQLGRVARVNYDAFWQPAFFNRQNFRFQTDVGLEVPAWKGLALTALYTFTHENVVPENIETGDAILSFGLSYLVRRR